jgi:undecaprenyl-diphosphatase
VGASGLRLVKFFLKGNAFTGTELAILGVGCLVAFVVSILVIRFLMGFIKKHDFKPFGWYRIALGVVVIAYFLFAYHII